MSLLALPWRIFRKAFVLMSIFFFGAGVVLYIVLWVVMPQEEWVEEFDDHAGDFRDP